MESSKSESTNRAEAAGEAVAAKFGPPGLRALAMFMHSMGSDARLVWGDEHGEEVWVACGYRDVLRLGIRRRTVSESYTTLFTNQGAALVEFAIIFPIMLLVGIGMLDLGIALFKRMQLEFSAEAGARCLAIGSVNWCPTCLCPTPAAAESYAAAANGASLAGATFAAAMLPSCGASMTAHYTYVPLILPWPLPLGASVCYP